MERFLLPGFRDRVLARSVKGPFELEAHDRNLAGGANHLAQLLAAHGCPTIPTCCRRRGRCSALFRVDPTRRWCPRHGICGDQEPPGAVTVF